MTDLERTQAMDKWAVNSWRARTQAIAEEIVESMLLGRKDADRVMMWPISMSVGWIVFARQPMQGRVN